MFIDVADVDMNQDTIADTQTTNRISVEKPRGRGRRETEVGENADDVGIDLEGSDRLVRSE